MKLDEVQAALREEGLDGWLFYDHHRRDPLAYRILGLSGDGVPTRRWYYFIPSDGEPRALCHRVEPHFLDQVPGQRLQYSRWSEQRDQLTALIGPSRVIAMQHSPSCAVPYVAMVDGGTIELIRSLGVEIRTSANLVQMFEARWTKKQFESHLEAGKRVDKIRAGAFELIKERSRNNSPLTEWEVKSFILAEFDRHNLFTDHGPIVGVNGNAADPHYEPTTDRNSPIRAGDFVLIDMWAKLKESNAVYYDITWTGFCGDNPRSDMRNVFEVVTGARDAAVNFIQDSVNRKQTIAGFEVDDVARGHIEAAGFADRFVHRTGHSIGVDVHGSGANMDNFETHDERRIIPSTCFSIEPGVYLSDFGVRSEVNVFVSEQQAIVTGEIQKELLIL